MASEIGVLLCADIVRTVRGNSCLLDVKQWMIFLGDGIGWNEDIMYLDTQIYKAQDNRRGAKGVFDGMPRVKIPSRRLSRALRPAEPPNPANNHPQWGSVIGNVGYYPTNEKEVYVSVWMNIFNVISLG